MKKPPGSEPTVNWKIRVPASTAAQIELLVMDPLTRKPSYGKRSELVSELLRNYLKSINFSLKDEVERLYPDEVKSG
jgi:hypothetical protein